MIRNSNSWYKDNVINLKITLILILFRKKDYNYHLLAYKISRNRLFTIFFHSFPIISHNMPIFVSTLFRYEHTMNKPTNTTREEMWAKQHLSATDINYSVWEQNKSILHQLSKISRNCTFVVDVYKCKYIYASPNFVDLLGYDSHKIETLERQGDYLESRIHPNDRAQLAALQVTLGQFIYSLPFEQRNNYSNIYTNAYTGNIQKNNAKETTEKQVVEQTEDVKTWTTRKTAADELSYLSKKFDNYSFVSANYSPRMKYGKSTTTNVAISPQFLTKMANDSDLEDEYIKEIGNMKKLDEQFAKQQADIGWRVEQGWAIDKDGNISSWAIGHKDSKVKSFLQNMSEKAEEIQQKQLEKAKDTKEEKEVFSMKKHKEVIKKNNVDLKV